MDIKEKQARWAVERPLFEAEFIHSYLLPFFKFNENTGDYEIKSECVNNTDDEDRKVAYEALNTGWAMWLRAKRTSKAVPEGYVMVPKCLYCNGYGEVGCRFEGTFTCPECNGDRINLKAVIEAQEST